MNEPLKGVDLGESDKTRRIIYKDNQRILENVRN